MPELAPHYTEDADRKTRLRLTLIRLRDEMFAADPNFKRRTIADLNAEVRRR